MTCGLTRRRLGEAHPSWAPGVTSDIHFICLFMSCRFLLNEKIFTSNSYQIGPTIRHCVDFQALCVYLRGWWSICLIDFLWSTQNSPGCKNSSSQFKYASSCPISEQSFISKFGQVCHYLSVVSSWIIWVTLIWISSLNFNTDLILYVLLTFFLHQWFVLQAEMVHVQIDIIEIRHNEVVSRCYQWNDFIIR